MGDSEAGDEVRSKTSSSSGFGSGSVSEVSDRARLGFSITVISLILVIKIIFLININKLVKL